ncbi:MAG: HAMP domain-containing histidine kinase [Deltaproteobacteria bacterium]|nr:HAMP domain-containing histidine kinase [Deltaproteobacteria bacterium]
MRLTIFWRAILAQSILIALILGISFYSHSKLNEITQLGASILSVDSSCITEEKQFLKSFLTEIRNAEKYLLFRDKTLNSAFTKAGKEFTESLEKVSSLVDTPWEKETLAKIVSSHDLYTAEIERAVSSKRPEKNKGERAQISDDILDMTNALIRFREGVIADKTAKARDQAASAAGMINLVAFKGILGAVLLAYLFARGVSSPLRKLAREMRRVGQGEFTRSVNIKAPKEVHDLAKTFNWMTDKLAELDKLKSDFTAHVSHELRTPLTAIKEGTSLLLEEIPGPLTPSQKEIVEVVSSHCEHLFQSISSILDLSRMKAQMIEYELVPCDLSGLIRQSIQKVELIARSRRIQLDIAHMDELPITVADEKRIQQVLDNLLSNALKFTPEGGRISVEGFLSKDFSSGQQQLQVRVSDTGEGIPKEERERIFNPFYQSPSDNGKGKQGTGLGLAIARYIIEGHKGAIWAESELGKGSAFIFTLPVVPPVGESPMPELQSISG